jgi:iron complex outermembrane recepter protein
MPDFRPPKAETMRPGILVAALLSATFASLCCAQAPPEKLASMSIEDLLNIEVTSVSKTQQKISETASAIYVITQEDIQSSGAMNIPDLLRMVPGMDVAQINANTWAISARGSNGRFSNELLVMVDGRTVYTPTFGGVLWDVLDLPLEDIERIEVIRGSAGSIWGANAVNGVVNIITKEASETKGMMVVAGGGNLSPGFGTVQYGGAAGQATSFRVYSKFVNQSQLPDVTGTNGNDGWHTLRGGFRVDSNISRKDSITVQGDIYTGREGQEEIFLPSATSPSTVQIPVAVNLSGGFLQAMWNHAYSARSGTSLQIYYDRYERDDILGERRGTFDIDFTHHLGWGARQNVVWGLGYRYSESVTLGSLAFSLDPANLGTRLFSSFVQDEIALVRDRLYLSAGTKLEHNYYTGFGLMPSIRLAWLPGTDHTLWAAVSRDLRTPSSLDASIRLNFAGSIEPDGTPVLFGVLGNPNIKDETSLSYEIGYRAALSERVSVDLTAYYDHLGNQETTEPAAPVFEASPAPPHLLIPLMYENLMVGESYGLEAFAKWKPSIRLTLSPGYAFEQIHMHVDPGSQDTTSVAAKEGSAPVNSAQFRSHLSLPHGLAWDMSAYFVGRIADPVVPSYTRLDTGLTWQASEKLSFSIFGQNLLKSERLEYVDTTGSTTSTLVKRGAYAKVKWAF